MTIDTITPYRDFSFRRGALIFRLLIFRLLKHIGFEIATTQRVQVAYALLDESSWGKHYGHVYGPMAPHVPNGSQDVAPNQ